MTLIIKPIPNFYQSKDFSYEHNRIVHRTLNRENFFFDESCPELHRIIASYFDCTSVERAGVLHGEYALDYLGFGLVRRDGVAFKINMSWEDPWGSELLDKQYTSEGFFAIKKYFMENWDNIPTVESPLILSHIFAQNYYHFTTDVITKLRFFPPLRASKVIIPTLIVANSFQKDLVDFLAAGRQFFLIEKPIRVRNPMLADGIMSEDGIYWLNQNFGANVSAGKRNIYIRRGATGSRMGGGGDIAQTPEFEGFLRDHNFETVAFGSGELSVRQQMSLLDGANIILCAHGAALTNIVYLKAPVSIIEVTSAMTPRAVFMHMASTLHLKYYGIFGKELDAANNIVVGREQLDEAIAVLARA